MLLTFGIEELFYDKFYFKMSSIKKEKMSVIRLLNLCINKYHIFLKKSTLKSIFILKETRYEFLEVFIGGNEAPFCKCKSSKKKL